MIRQTPSCMSTHSTNTISYSKFQWYTLISFTGIDCLNLGSKIISAWKARTNNRYPITPAHLTIKCNHRTLSVYQLKPEVICQLGIKTLEFGPFSWDYWTSLGDLKSVKKSKVFSDKSTSNKREFRFVKIYVRDSRCVLLFPLESSKVVHLHLLMFNFS